MSPVQREIHPAIDGKCREARLGGTGLVQSRSGDPAIDDGALAIGKFPSVQDERSVTQGEDLAMRLAANAGIPTGSLATRTWLGPYS